MSYTTRKDSMNNLVYQISGNGIPKLKEVGGKGLSLIKMKNNGLPVPHGFILTVAFFQPWFDELKNSDEWQLFQSAGRDRVADRCKALQGLCSKLKFTSEQRQVVEKGLAGFSGSLWAARSSSPEEDLEGASFAGGYETILGVKSGKIESAVNDCFASCLDYRVYLYKIEHGFAPGDPKIAVVVQEQIPSEVAGVGFSVNPMSNCYDEVVFNSNWGQGETVVSGLVSPDNFVVDKVSFKVLEQTIGGKETSIWLGEGGGTRESPSDKKDKITLSEKQLGDLTRMIVKVEEYYEKPMDIEWALANNKLYLLQARPVTTYIPLPKELITPPGSPKRLYFDLTLGIQGIHEPVSIMGIDWLNSLFSAFSCEVFGEDLITDLKQGILCSKGGRLYINLSHLLCLVPKDTYVSVISNMDSITADTLRDLDLSGYMQEGLPDKMKGIKGKAFLHIPDIFAKLIEGHFLPKMLEKKYLRNMVLYQDAVLKISSSKGSFSELSSNIIHELIHLLVHTSAPAIISFIKSQKEIQTIFSDEPDETEKLVNSLTSSLPHNVTVEMGLAIYGLSRILPVNELKSREKLLEKVINRQLPEEFLNAWDEFMDKYGFRGPRELDLAAPRYCDRPESIIAQLCQLAAVKDNESNPQAHYDRAQVERHQAFESLSEMVYQKGWLKLKHFQRLFQIAETLGGYRESHKYDLIFGNNLIRREILKTAEKLVSAGRIDCVDQIFNLEIADVDEAIGNPSLDLRKLIKARTEYFDQIKNIKNFPRLIDSRGTILRPPRKDAGPGEIIGQGVSAGIARGPVKVLDTPDEKPVLPGDILVTRATDPGWTPLFINAAAVVLEVGGMLQHGALVAREYGKPCVVGIDNVASILKDGQQIEVDGSNGIIKLL